MIGEVFLDILNDTFLPTSELFRNVLNASFQGSIVILAVLLLRLLLRKAPKKYICLLWILVGVRLLCPFSFESRLSLQPQEQIVTQSEWEDLRDYGEIFPENTPTEALEIYVPEVEERPVEDELPEHPEVTVTVKTEINWAMVAPYLWLIGIGILIVYSLASYLRLKWRVREAVHLFDDVWECTGIDTAFILGFRNPRIYLPMGLKSDSQRFILNHEQTHLDRRDHWVKLFGFIAVTVHWFNPLVWLAYALLCRDVEMACDERVIRDMGLEERKQYSAALLECSANRAHWAACPVAFGEVSVKQRILSVLNYRKPAFWLSVIGVIAVIFVAVCFLTNPSGGKEQTLTVNEEWEQEIREVLEEIQSRDAYAIIEQRQFAGEKVLNDSADFNFFRYGDCWLTVSYIDGVAENEFTGYLRLNGEAYEAVSGEAVFDWQPSELTEFPQPWLYTFDMDSQEASAISRKDTGEGYEIRLLVQDAYIGLGDSFYVDFGFDQEGNFRSAILYASGMEEVMGDTVETSSTTFMYVHNNTEVDIAGTIKQYAGTLDREFDIFLGTATVDAPDWGIQVTIRNITPTGLIFEFIQSGELIGQQLFYGQYYSLERRTDSGWEAVAPIIDNWGFTLEAFAVKEDAVTTVPINWKWLYGELPDGTYRIGKNVSNMVEYRIGTNGIMAPQNAEETNYTYYAEFTIPAE